MSNLQESVSNNTIVSSYSAKACGVMTIINNVRGIEKNFPFMNLKIISVIKIRSAIDF